MNDPRLISRLVGPFAPIRFARSGRAGDPLTPPGRRAPRWLWTVATSAGLVFGSASADEKTSDAVVAVYSSVSPYYTRTTLPGGGFKPETYAFGEGGSQSPMRDLSFDKLTFMDVAKTVAPHLATKGYLPCAKSDPAQANLLIMVYWGLTVGTDNASSSAQYQIAQSFVPPPQAPVAAIPVVNADGDMQGMLADPATSGRGAEALIAGIVADQANSALQQSMIIAGSANRQRDRQDTENASILGYVHEMRRVEGYQNSAAFRQRRQDILDEIEESRYYVVLMAYDFQELRQNKQKKILWETRLSIRERGSDFSQELAAMVASASRYFGENSDGLKRKSLREGRIDLGELKVIGIEPDKK